MNSVTNLYSFRYLIFNKGHFQNVVCLSCELVYDEYIWNEVRILPPLNNWNLDKILSLCQFRRKSCVVLLFTNIRRIHSQLYRWFKSCRLILMFTETLSIKERRSLYCSVLSLGYKVNKRQMSHCHSLTWDPSFS